MTKLPFSDDAIIRTDGPTILHCGSAPFPRPNKCRTGCRTKDHESYDACLKDAGTGTFLVKASKGEDASAQKRWDGELHAYYNARKEGIQPDGTTMPKIEEAKRLSDQAGAAYGRDFSKADPM